MTQRLVGVTDKAAAQPGIADYRTRERTVSGSTVAEQYLIRVRDRVESTVWSTSLRNAVAVAADAATAYRWMILNPSGSGVTLAIRSLEIVALQVTNVLCDNGPSFTFERWTATGTATGGTQATTARVLSGNAPVGRFYTAAPTGLTTAKVATAWTFFPTVNLNTTANGTNPHSLNWPVAQEYHTSNPTFEVAPAQAVVFRQADAGAAADGTARYMLTSVQIEEFTRP